MRITSLWLLAIAFAMCWSIIVLPVRGDGTPSEQPIDVTATPVVVDGVTAVHFAFLDARARLSWGQNRERSELALLPPVSGG